VTELWGDHVTVRRASGVGLLLLTAVAVVPAGFATAETSPDAMPPGSAKDSPQPPHPEPRVVVNVLSVRGPHPRPDVERSARLGWGRIVSCYNSLGQRTRGMVEVELVVSGDGRVSAVRRRRSTLKSPELAQCLTNALRRLAMPKAHARSTAVTEIHVAPGDPS
jgi:hypothetical protein